MKVQVVFSDGSPVVWGGRPGLSSDKYLVLELPGAPQIGSFLHCDEPYGNAPTLWPDARITYNPEGEIRTFKIIALRYDTTPEKGQGAEQTLREIVLVVEEVQAHVSQVALVPKFASRPDVIAFLQSRK